MSSKLKLVLAPSPSLRKKSREVLEDEFGEALDKHMDAMLVKMSESNGVGLSGIQIGDDRRILVADAGSGPIKAVNPEILEASEETVIFTEGCLSMPGLRLDVERSKYVTIRYKTPYGETIEGTISDAHAVIFQHEMEHLDGTSLLDKISNLKKNMYLKKLKKKLKARNRLIKELKKLDKMSSKGRR